MVQDTHLAHLKMLEDSSVSKHRVRKLENLDAPSLLDKKLETSGSKIPESLMRGSIRAEHGVSSKSYTNSKKCASEVLTKNETEDLRIRSRSTCDKANKSTCPPTMKRKQDGGSVSSSTDNSIRNASPHAKQRKVDDENRTSGAADRKSEDNGKKTIRKHLHVRAYKKLFTKHAKAGGNQDCNDKCIKEKTPLQGILAELGANTSKEVKEGGDAGSTKEDVKDERELHVETIESLEKKESKNKNLFAATLDARSPPDAVNQEHQTTFSGSKCERMIPNLEFDNFLEPSGQEIHNHNPCEMNMKSPPCMFEELGVRESGACNAEFLGTPDQQIAEDSIHVVLKDSISTSQPITALIHNVCLVCKQPGQLICCCGKGCKRSYHLSCFNPLLHDVPPGAWLCNFCVKKKMESGVYSVSDGIEAIWDVDEGTQSGKRYFVKYKGLAHVHNRWIPESELLSDAPSLLAKFRKNGQREVNKWRKEWAKPERLLQKRLVAAPEVVDEYTSVSVSESLNCCIEWFVKWKGLEYDQATWELENSLLLLCSSEAPRLVEDYESRREHARRLYDPLRADKALRVKKDPFCKLSKLPDGCPVELDNDHLFSVNCLREFWFKSLNAVFIDAQERISKLILFVVSLQSHACRPSLIITTSCSLPLWQANFLRLAPSMNVIVYQCDKDVRKMIQNLEFYEESGRLMFQVLLADLKAIVEDLADIACIGWESIIVDECQNSKTTRYLEQLNILNTDFKVLLFNGQLKDHLSENRILLSFLNTGITVDCGLVGLNPNNNETPGALTNVKDKLAHHIAYECKTGSSKFLEYWVPVPLSSVQLEQYCAILLSNANVLRSNSRSDVVGALHNILITTRKCCDHPYLVDVELRGLLTKGLQGTEFLNAEVCASGKLYLLGKILQEMKDRGLRVVILFQSLGGPGKVSLGDILDDFLQQRFGVNSYERIEIGLVMAKKLAALTKFNNKETGRFAFLIEKRACLPSVKLRLVDAIILFDSDWNPLNDIRSLQKINIESQHNCIKVFRFYTSYTVEEKLLMLAKQDIILESSVQNISRHITHSLIAWGTSYLFQKLDQLHSCATPTCISEPSFDKLCLNDVISEILTQFPGESDTSTNVPCSILTKARLSGGTYSRNIVLVGEKEGFSLPDKDLPNFWSGLLEGRHPKWMHISEHSQRIRRRIQNENGLVIQAVEGDEVKNKRRKINNIVDPVTVLEFSQEKGDAPKEVQKSCMLESEGGEQKLEDQRNLLMLLRPELSELCDILGLPESVKGTAQEFLVYIMNNHDVCLNQVTVLQALKISLCWRAASMSMHKLDHDGSLALAKKYLKFECTEQEAYFVYSKLQILEEKFPCQSGALENFLDNQSSPSKPADDGREQPLHGRAKEITASDKSALGVTNGFPICHKSSEQVISPEGCHSICETPGKFQPDIGSVKDVFKNQIDLIKEDFLRRTKELGQRQRAEASNFEEHMYEERVKLKKAHDLDLELIRSIHIDSTMRNGKISVLTQEFSANMGRFYQHLKQQKQKLVSIQHDVRGKERKLRYCWLEKAKTSKIDESLDDVPGLESGSRLEKHIEASEYTGNCNNSGAVILNPACPSYETNTESEGCLEVPSNMLNGREENDRLGDDVVDNSEHIEQNRISVEPSVLPELSGVLPTDSGISAPLPEVLKQFTGRTVDLLTCSTTTTEAFNFEQLDDRDVSNGLHLVPNPELNKGVLLSSMLGSASSVSASTLSSIQELCADEHRRPARAASGNNEDMDSSHEATVSGSRSVSQSPHIEAMSCNDATSSDSTHCQSLLAEHEQERFPPLECQEVASELHHFVDQAEVQQQETATVVVESEPSNCEIPENVMHPLRSQEYLPSEGIPSEHLGSTGIQQGMDCSWSHSSTQQAEVPVQDAIEAAVVENDPSIQQISENTFYPMRPLEDLPLERAGSEHLRSTSTQREALAFHNFPSIEWVPPQAIYADPIHNEIFRLRKQNYSCTKNHENKKVLLQLECEQEIEKVRRKYDALLQDAEREYLSNKKIFERIYQKVCLHKVFAEEVRGKFYDHKEGSSTSFKAPSRNSSQHLQASRLQPQLPSRPISTLPPAAPSTASRHHSTQTISQASTAHFRPIPRSQASAPPAVTSIHTFPVISINTVRGPIRPGSNLQVNRSPAPHLQRFRPHASVPPPNLGSALRPTFPSTQPSITPPSSGLSPLHFSAPLFELPLDAGGDDLLESLLADLPATGDEFPSSGMIDSRPNASPYAICLSDED